MRRIILTDPAFISPFNETARDLRVQNKPLWLWQRDLLNDFAFEEEREYESALEAKEYESDTVVTFVHRDNIFFNHALIENFIEQAKQTNLPCQIAFSVTDPAIANHVRPLSHSFSEITVPEKGDLLVADMWYLPNGCAQIDQAQPLVIETEARERGYYTVPPYMATEFGDLVYQLPRKVFVPIDNWVHLFVANILFGVFARGADVEEKIDSDWRLKLKILFRSVIEQKHVLANSEVVRVGKDCNIDPTAVIHGYTTIGDNVIIGAGAVIDNCIIGDNVTVSQGCQLMLSVVGDGCFLPFRAALFMTTLMENTSVAQNSCLQVCVVGRDSFIGAGNTFTDFNILGGSLRTFSNEGRLEDTNLLILGGCVGHHCRLSSGNVIYAARTIESDVVLIATEERHFITHNISYEDSDHHKYADKYEYLRFYPRQGET